MGDVSVRACVPNTRGMEKRHVRLLRTDAGRFLRPGNACKRGSGFPPPPTFDCCGLWREVSFINRPFVLHKGLFHD